MATTVITRTVVVQNPHGLHIRPARLVAQEAMRHPCTIEVVRDGIRADAKSILNLMTLGAVQGSQLMVEARGESAEQAAEAIVAILANDLGQDEADSDVPQTEGAGPEGRAP